MRNQENEHELSVLSGTAANTASTQGLLISTPGGLSQTNQHVEFFIKKIPRRMRLMKKCARRAQNRARRAQKQKRKDRQNYLIRLCRLSLKIFVWLLMVLGFVFAIYLAYHFSGPANDIGQKGLDATVWGNYYNWVWTICPAMEVSYRHPVPFQLSLTFHLEPESYNDWMSRSQEQYRSASLKTFDFCPDWQRSILSAPLHINYKCGSWHRNNLSGRELPL